MIAATLTTRLAQDGIDKRAITAFSLAFLVYNLKWLWAWVVDGVRLPIIGRLGQRVSWLLFAGALAMAAIVNLALVDPSTSLTATALAAILVAIAGATYDIVIDAYRIESLEPRQLGVGSGMSQYGWRIGSVAAASLALVVAARAGWQVAYLACAAFALPAMAVGLILGEPPERHREPPAGKGFGAIVQSVVGPLAEFFRRQGAALVLLFVLLHKIGDTLANLTFRLLFEELQYTNDEIALYDVGFGFWGYLAGIFVGGMLYARLGMKRAVLLNVAHGHPNCRARGGGKSSWAMAAAISFECRERHRWRRRGRLFLRALRSATAAQYALISAQRASLRVLTGAKAGALIEGVGYVNFYLLTTVVALPGILLFWLLMRAGSVDGSLGARPAAIRAVDSSPPS
jgi:PAT family beta-lactamase induction signal transducer AmpG